MFTGIVSGVGRILDVRPLGTGATHGVALVVEAPPGYLDDAAPGDSLALNGACMTVTRCDAAAGRFEVDVSAESLACTAGLATPGPVNLEKALRAADRLGGHLVTGHVDGIGTVARVEPAGESIEFGVVAPPALGRFLAQKGSVAVNGVSLTVNRVEAVEGGCAFTINLIPHTLAQTTLGRLGPGDRVNLEVDLIARYVERMLGERLLGGSPTEPHA